MALKGLTPWLPVNRYSYPWFALDHWPTFTSYCSTDILRFLSPFSIRSILVNSVKLLVGRQDNQIAKYKEALAAYMQFSNAYQRDQEWYITYQDTARKSRSYCFSVAAISASFCLLKVSVELLATYPWFALDHW